MRGMSKGSIGLDEALNDYILRVAAKDLEDYERIHRDWLSALPHVVKINSSFALREIIDKPNVGL